MKNKRNMKKTLLIVLAVIVALIMLVLGGIALYVDHLIGLLVVNPSDPDASSMESMGSLLEDPDDTLPSDHTLPTVDVSSPSTGPVELIEVEDVINVMLLGQDASNGVYRTRTDTMILCTIHTKERTMSLTSFQRDLYVYIPGWGGYHKLNSAYPFGGYEMFKDTMAYNFGLEIDFIVHVKYEQFAQVVDILGGVDMDLTAAEANYLNNYYYSVRGELWSLTEGRNHLTGTQAFEYSRIRYLDSDFFRTERQRKVLNAIFEAYKQKPITKLLGVTEQIMPLIYTYDLEKEDVYRYIFTLAPSLSGCTIDSYQIPYAGSWQYASADGMSIIDADLEANREYLAQIINP